jgi:hypothetical protein
MYFLFFILKINYNIINLNKMNLGENNINNNNNSNNEELTQLFSDIINNIKEKNYTNITQYLLKCKELIIQIIKEIGTKNNINKDNILFINKKLITQLSFFKNINILIKDYNLLFQIKTFLNHILLIIFEEENYSYIYEPSLIQDFLTHCLNIVYLNSKSNLIFLLLIKKIDNFIQYISNKYPIYKDSILKLRKKFSDYHSKEYINQIIEFISLNIYDLSKSNNLKDKKESLLLITKYFNDLQYYTEKYELLNNIYQEIFPSLLNLTLPSLSHQKNTKNIELYINFGKFLLKFF